VTWLGVRLVPRVNKWTGKMRLAYLIPDEKVQRMLERVDEMTTLPSERINPDAFDLGRWLVSINEQLRDWHQAYQYADNAADVFRTVDERGLGAVARLLQRITGVRGKQLARGYLRRLPRGFWTWEVNGVRLKLLSTLAPRRPYALIRRPDWMRVPLQNADPNPQTG
jgi:hypothetical protein